MTTYDTNILVKINSLLILDIMEWHCTNCSAKHLYINCTCAVHFQHCNCLIFNPFRSTEFIRFNTYCCRSLMPATSFLLCHAFLCIKYLNKMYNKHLLANEHTRHGCPSSNCDGRPLLQLSNKKKYFKKLTRTSYGNKKDH